MVGYVIRRLLQIIPVLLMVITINFALVRMAPGDPAVILAGKDAPKERVELIRTQLGLDRPVIEQYLIYLRGVAQGDLGTSYSFKQPVRAIILDRLPATLLLTGTAFLFSSLIGIGLGIWSARANNTWLDRAIGGIALTLYSVPVFWLGLLLLLIFGVHLHLLPTQGMRTVTKALTGWRAFVDVARHLVLPGITLAVVQVAEYLRLSKASMVETLGKQYIRTARAKGLAERKIFYKHALRNAMIPTVTAVGLRMGFLFSGAAVIEIVFGWPGIGRILYNAVFARDYPLLLGGFIVTALTVSLSNLVVDLSYRLIDPRIKVS